MKDIKKFVLLIVFVTIFSHPMHREIMSSLQTKPAKEQFKIWHGIYKMPYDLNTPFAIQKYKAFKANLEYIQKRNSEQSEVVLGLGPFSDLTFEEFKATLPNSVESPKDVTITDLKKKTQGGKLSKAQSPTKAQYKGTEFFDKYADADEDFPSVESNTDDNLSYFDKYADSDEVPQPKRKLVENLGVGTDYSYLFDYVFDSTKGCRAASTHAAIDMFEAFWQLNGNPGKLRLSRQQIIDCDVGSGGCAGSFFPDKVIFYVADWGLAEEKDYPYAGKLQKCTIECQSYKPKVELNELVMDYCFPESTKSVCNESKIKSFLKKGPYASVFDASNQDFQNYTSGVLSYSCFFINHGALVVQGDTNFLKVRLSLGSTFGENGYARFKRKVRAGGNDTTCGLEVYAWQSHVNPWVDE